jgi:pimeloyl-ACP methyl ester carboxylesterase
VARSTQGNLEFKNAVNRTIGMMNRVFCGLAFIPAAALLHIAAPAFSAPFTFKIVADTEGSNFSSLSGPSVNDSDTVAFVAGLDDGGVGVFTVSDGTVTTIAESRDPLIESYFSPPSINNSGAVAFASSVFTGAFDDGFGIIHDFRIFVGTDSGLTTIADSTMGDLTFFGAPSMNNSGTVAFTGFLQNVGSGIYVGSGGEITELLGPDNPTIGGQYGYTPINDAGTVAFVGTTVEGYQLFTVSGPAPQFDRLASLPPTSLNPGYSLGAAVGINNVGDVLYLHGDGIFTANESGQASTIVGASDSMFSSLQPILVVENDTVIYREHSTPSINDHGAVAFFAVDSMENEGLYLANAPGIFQKIVQTGDALAGSTVVRLVVTSEGLNNLGRVAFLAELADGRELIVLGSVVPEPSSATLALLFGLIAVSCRSSMLVRTKGLLTQGTDATCTTGTRHWTSDAQRVAWLALAVLGLLAPDVIAAGPVNYTSTFVDSVSGASVPVQLRTWLPDDVERVRGMVVAIAGNGGDIRNITSNGSWQAKLNAIGFGIIGVRGIPFTTWGETPAVAASNIQSMLDGAAVAMGRPEIGNAPIFPFGFSNGGFQASNLAALAPERVLGFLGDKGAFPEALSSPAKQVPGFIAPGAFDAVVTPDYLRFVFDDWRLQGAEVGLAIDWTDHGQTTADFRFSILGQLIKSRYPQGQLPSTTPNDPLELVPVEFSSGWLVESNPVEMAGPTPIVTPIEWPAIAPQPDYPLYPVNPSLPSWVVNETMALVLRAHNSRPAGDAIRLQVLNASNGNVDGGAPIELSVIGPAPDEVLLYHENELLATLVTGMPLRYSYTPRESGIHTFIGIARYGEGDGARYTSDYVVVGAAYVPVPEPGTELLSCGVLLAALWSGSTRRPTVRRIPLSKLSAAAPEL